MKIKYFLYVSLFHSIVNAQNDLTSVLQVDYIRKIQYSGLSGPSGLFNGSAVSLSLIQNLNISLYDQVGKPKADDLSAHKDADNMIIWNPKGKNLNLVYKDYSKEELYSKDIIGFKFFTIKDSLNIFQWEILPETKFILGYNCQMATTEFRGRNYEAWFCPDLPKGGPWKFDGLPGLILSIKSIDDYISFEPQKITIKRLPLESIVFENPLAKEKYLTWSEFKEMYKKKAIALSKYKTESTDGSGILTPRIRTERYIEESDIDYVADKKFFIEKNNIKN